MISLLSQPCRPPPVVWECFDSKGRTVALVIDRETFKSPNCDRDGTMRPIPMRPRGIVLHSGDGTRKSDLSWLCNPDSGAGAHYYVCRDGTVYGLMPDNHQAWHAGDSLLAGIKDWNSFAIGIETEHTKGVHHDYPGVQQQALRALCRDLIVRYSIKPGFIQSHRAITKHRRTNLRDDPRDWPEITLRTWVALLYQPPPELAPTPDPWAAWGDAYPLPESQRGWGIPQLWRENTWLGSATSYEVFPDENTSIRTFRSGYIVYEKLANQAKVYRRLKEMP